MMTDVTGEWACSVNTPMGKQDSTLVLKADDGVITGENRTPMGTLVIEDGKIDGNALSWTCHMKIPMPMTLETTAIVNGDTITGSVKAGMFGSSPLSASRII